MVSIRGIGNQNSTNENGYTDVNSELHKQIYEVYKKKTLGSRVIYIALGGIITIVVAFVIINNMFKVNTDITNKDCLIIAMILLAIILIDLIIFFEQILIPKNVKLNKLKYKIGHITGKRLIGSKNAKGAIDSENNSESELYVGNEVFKLACEYEYRYIDTNTSICLIYTKAPLINKYIPLLAYMPDKIGLDYELLSTKEFSFEQFRNNVLNRRTNNINNIHSDSTEAIENYHDDLDGQKTDRLLELERNLANAEAGSKEQLKIMESIGEERHRIKKLMAKKNRFSKLREIIAIIRR